jgi:hypothetical protein
VERFACRICANEVRFDASSCPQWHRRLGYVPGDRTIRTLEPVGGGVCQAIRGRASPWWRCLNAAWDAIGSYWLARDQLVCRASALLRGPSDDARPYVVDAWSRAETARWRLIQRIDGLALPVESRSPATPNGLAFDLVRLSSERGLLATSTAWSPSISPRQKIASATTSDVRATI